MRATSLSDGKARGHIPVFGDVNNRQPSSQPSPLSRRAVFCDGCDDRDDHSYCYGRRGVYAQAKGVLPGDKPMREATARHCATVRGQTEVCRVCGLHSGEGWALNSHPLNRKWLPLAKPVLASISGDFDAENRLNGHRDSWPKKRVSVQWTPFVTQSYDFGAVMSIL